MSAAAARMLLRDRLDPEVADRAVGRRVSRCPRPRLLLGLIGASTLLRAGYDAMVNPRNALDSATYHDIGAGIAAHGLLSSDVPFLPYYPGGYPLLLGALYEVAGTSAQVGRALSLILLGVTAYLAWHLVAREVGERVAWLVAGVLAFSPALTGVASVLSYEPLLAALLVFATDQVSRAIRAGGSGATWHAAAAGAVLGYAVVVQSKSVFALVAVGAWLLWQSRRVAPIAALAMLALPAPAAYGLRTEHVHGRFQPTSTNFGAVMVTGFNDRAKGTFTAPNAIPPRCRPNHDVRFWVASPFESERRLRSCATDWIKDNPGSLPLLETRKLLYFFGPSIGPPGSAIYMYRLDPRDALPDTVTASRAFEVVDGVIRAAWALVAIALLLLGLRVVRAARREFAWVAFAIVVGFALVTLATLGDPRYRYPVETFTLVLQGSAVLWAWEVLRTRNASRRSPAGLTSVA